MRHERDFLETLQTYVKVTQARLRDGRIIDANEELQIIEKMISQRKDEVNGTAAWEIIREKADPTLEALTEHPWKSSKSLREMVEMQAEDDKDEKWCPRGTGLTCDACLRSNDCQEEMAKEYRQSKEPQCAPEIGEEPSITRGHIMEHDGWTNCWRAMPEKPGTYLVEDHEGNRFKTEAHISFGKMVWTASASKGYDICWWKEINQ